MLHDLDMRLRQQLKLLHDKIVYIKELSKIIEDLGSQDNQLGVFCI